MKKNSHRILFFVMAIVGAVIGATILAYEHLGAGITIQPAMAPDAIVVAPAIASQTFSNDGYTLSVPAPWTIEQTGTDTIAIHPDATSPDVACKIEISAFSYSSDTDTADWIAHRIGADPSLTISEQSSEDVTLTGGSGIKWIGTIDGIPTTLVYAFNNDHAYEIAPSVIGNVANGSMQCDDMLQVVLSSFTL